MPRLRSLVRESKTSEIWTRLSLGVDDAGIFQLVSVEPNTAYDFTGYYRNGEIEGAGAPHFVLQDIYSSKVFFQSDDLKFGSSWRQVSGTFTTDDDTRMLVLRVARLPAGSPIRGKLRQIVDR